MRQLMYIPLEKKPIGLKSLLYFLNSTNCWRYTYLTYVHIDRDVLQISIYSFCRQFVSIYLFSLYFIGRWFIQFVYHVF